MTVMNNMKMNEGHPECLKTFQLDCLKEENKDILAERLESYLHHKKLSMDHSKIKIGKDGPKDFTPWWDSFSKKSSNETLTCPNVSSHTDPDRYDSWFSESSTSESSWLAGNQKSTSSSKTDVEDISVPSIYEQKLTSKGKRALKRERKAQAEKTLGKKWFGMKAPDADDPIHVDMELIRMRGVLDPKRFYKNHDRRAAPKYFQMGTVVDEGTEFYGSRLTKKQRKNTLVEQLMADANVRQYNKKKYAELQQKMRGKKKQKSKKT